jgi:hypothetical protein
VVVSGVAVVGVWVGFRPIRFISSLSARGTRAKSLQCSPPLARGGRGACAARGARSLRSNASLLALQRNTHRFRRIHAPPSRRGCCVCRSPDARQAALNLALCRARDNMIFSPNLRGAAVGVWATRPTQALASHPICMRVLFKATSASARLRALTGSRGVVFAPCLCTHASLK